jgi:hypothetical protein
MELHIVEIIDVLGILSCEKVEIVGEVLTDHEGFEAVGHQGFRQLDLLIQDGADGHRLPGQDADLPEDGGGGGMIEPGHGPDAHSGSEAQGKLVEVEIPLAEVIDAESLTAELFSTGFAQVSPHRFAGSCGMVESRPVIPGIMGLDDFAGEMVGTMGVGTEGRFGHNRLLGY